MIGLVGRLRSGWSGFLWLEEMVVPWQKTTRSNQNPARILLDLTRSHRIGEDLVRSNVARSGEISPDLVRSHLVWSHPVTASSSPRKRREREERA